MERAARVLVVDEESRSCECCSEVLASAGCEVNTTSDLARGLQLVQRERYDFVLVDNKNHEADGDDYVRSLRQRAQGASIIVLANRPSVDEAVRTMKGGAADYLSKPLEPSQLLHALQRGMEQRKLGARACEDAAGASGPAAQPWQPAGPELLFGESVWLQSGQDGSMRVGSLSTRQVRSSLRLAALAGRGSCVREGLPLATLTDGEGNHQPVLAPFDGRVVEVNPRAAEHTRGPLHDDWLLRLDPAGERLPDSLSKRSIVLFDPEACATVGLSSRLQALGLTVRVATSAKDCAHALHCDRADLLFVSSSSTGVSGPEQVRWIRSVVPDARVVVLGAEGSPRESQWRQLGIAYFAAAPWDDAELTDLFAGLVQPRPRPMRRSVRPHHGTPPWLHGLETTNGRGRRVKILVSGQTLAAAQGVGLHLVNQLLNACRPITTLFGERVVDPTLLRESSADWDRVLLLQAADMGQVPGSLIENIGLPVGLGQALSAGRLLTLGFQTDPEHPGTLHYCDNTSAAIASYIHRCVQEL